MILLRDGVIALLAAVGITALLWMALIWFFRRHEAATGAVFLLPLRGSGEGLEYRIHTLLEQRQRLGARMPVVMLDCGLDAAGRRRAELLPRRCEGVTLADLSELTKLLEAEPPREGTDYGRTEHGDGHRTEHDLSE